jgi:uncharacterized membrane protein
MKTQNDKLPDEQENIQYVGLYRPRPKAKRLAKKAIFLITFLPALSVGFVFYFSPYVFQQAIYGQQAATLIYVFAVIALLIWLYHYLLERRRRKMAERKQFVEEAMRIRRENYREVKEAIVLDTRPYNEIKNISIDTFLNKDINRYYDRPDDYFRPNTNNRGTSNNRGPVANKSYYIEYQDADGNITNRVITIKNIKREGYKIYIKGYCHLRDEKRTFLRDRIIGDIVDTETGEVVSKEALEPPPRKKRK